MVNDPYQTLGVPRDASDEEITKAYRKLAKQYHPDLNPNDPQAAQKMSAINEAFDQIKNGPPGQNTQDHYYNEQDAARGYGQGGGYSQGYGYGDSYSGQGYGEGPQMEATQMARFLIQLGQYRQAYQILSQSTERTGEWYYLSAIVQDRMGNPITALDHARHAVSLDPNNEEYNRVLSQLEAGAHTYERQAASYGGNSIMNWNMCCLGLCLAQYCCCPRQF